MGPCYPLRVHGCLETDRNRPKFGGPPLRPDGKNRLRPGPPREMRFSCADLAFLEQWGTLHFVPPPDPRPRILSGFSEPKQIQIFGVYNSLLAEEDGVENTPPIFFSNEDHRDGRCFSGLRKRQDFEEFVERAKATRKDHECSSPQNEMQLSDREIMKLKRQITGDIR